METRSTKRKRLMIATLDKAYQYTGEDRISELSNDVLHHILSLLPTKTIVRMSILSKRWNLIWSSFADLDFTSTPHFVAKVKARKRMGKGNHATTNVLDFISHVLFSNKKRSDIRALRFSAELSFTRLNRLIKQAVRRNVQELDLVIRTEDCFNLTRSVVNCKSLRVLKLRSQKFGMRLPPSTTMKGGFQSLHTLSLSQIVFDTHSELRDFFSETSFPNLKKLELADCQGLKSLRIACRGIVDITLDCCVKLIDLSICCWKLERLRVRRCFDGNTNSGCVKIEAPLIKIFFWEFNSIVESIFVENIIYLEKAILLLKSNDLAGSRVSSVANLLSAISYSRCVTLNSECFKILSTNNSRTSILPHSLNNLKELQLQISFDKKQIMLLASLLRISPSLHTLIINIDSAGQIEMKELDKEVWDPFISEEVYWKGKIQGLNTFVHNVKVLKINANNENALVCYLALFLNKYGICLQEMTLSLKNSKARERLKSQFDGFPWASSIAKIDFGT